MKIVNNDCRKASAENLRAIAKEVKKDQDFFLSFRFFVNSLLKGGCKKLLIYIDRNTG